VGKLSSHTSCSGVLWPPSRSLRHPKLFSRLRLTVNTEGWVGLARTGSRSAVEQAETLLPQSLLTLLAQGGEASKKPHPWKESLVLASQLPVRCTDPLAVNAIVSDAKASVPFALNKQR